MTFRTVVTWLAGLVAASLVTTLLAAIPFSYLLGLVGKFIANGNVGWMDNLVGLPPLFFPILAILSLLILAPSGIVAPLKQWWNKPPPLQIEIERVYKLVERVHKPQILSPENPGSLPFMQAQAQNAVDVLRSVLLKQGLSPPQIVDFDQSSSRTIWYDYLRTIRVEIR